MHDQELPPVRLGRPMASTVSQKNVAQEKAAILKVTSDLGVVTENLHNQISYLIDTLQPISNTMPEEQPSDSVGYEYIGSSELYERLVSVMNDAVGAIRRIETIRQRVEV